MIKIRLNYIMIMKAWVINSTSDLASNHNPLQRIELPIPVPGNDEIVIKVSCCGICHTELDEIEGRTSPSTYPLIPGHQVIGIVDRCGTSVSRFEKGNRVGVAWIFSACGKCEFCLSGFENLCPEFKGTGRDRHGGYAEYMVINEQFAYSIPSVFSDHEAAPLLCAGAVGYRALMLAELSNGQTLALTGFGASGQQVLKMAKFIYPKSEIFVFTRDIKEQLVALELGASWAGTLLQTPPHKANSIIDTTPVWNAITHSLYHLKPGGKLVINVIRKETADKNSLLELNYQEDLWMEKEIKTVANIIRSDVEKYLALAASIPLKPEIEIYPFERANEAIWDLKNKPVKGAKVLSVLS